MSGLRSRRKGKKNEYLLRDYFRSLGYDAHRVPSSGASQGFKGDVEIKLHNEKLVAELKVRQNEFKSIYALFDTHSCNGKPFIVCHSGVNVLLCADFTHLGYTESVPLDRIVDAAEIDKRTLKKLLNLEKLVKDCDFLVIRIDRKPFLFLRFWSNA